MTALSWQPPPVTKCGECQHANTLLAICFRKYTIDKHNRHSEVFAQNKDGITESCPAWQQQNKNNQ